MKTTVKLLIALWFLGGALVSAAIAAPLQVKVAPAGAGTLSLSQSGSEQVMLSATPSDGYLFSGFTGWSGGTTGGETQTSLTLTANFIALQEDSALPGTLAVAPGMLAASGAIGGPFAPASFTYLVRNTGSSAIQWGVATTASWLTLSASGGSLAPGAETALTVTLAGSAGGLEVGYHTDTLSFSNLTNGLGDTARPASLVVTYRQGEIAIVTDGDSFSPVLTVDAGARVHWNWGDGTTSSSAAPAKNFGSRALRLNGLTVTPWSALKRINLGYGADDGGAGTIERVAAQPVLAVSGLELVAPYLQQWCSSRARIASLNLDNFVSLDTVECFQCNALLQVGLHNTPRLSRACFEGCQLGALDLSESPALADLRAAANPYPGIDFGATGARTWHLCTRDNQFARSLPPMTQFPQLRELLIWNDNQTGALATASSQLSAVLASHNRYTSADFSGGFTTGNGWLDVSDNQLSSLNLAGCPGLVDIFAANNSLAPDAVDSVLETLDSLGRFGGYLDLQGNSPPSASGLQHVDSLRQRAWNVALAGDEQVQAPPGSIAFSTENDDVIMAVQVVGNPAITWHWSDGASETGSAVQHHFPQAGHRAHYLTVEPLSALYYFGVPYGIGQQGISSVSGLSNFPSLSVVNLSGESLAGLDISGCAPVRDLHLAGNQAFAPAALDKVFADLDALGGYGGTVDYPAAVATPASAAARARLVQKGWRVNPL